jgi:CspA family cold shock protein
MPKQTGKVKFFNEEKGFGFITDTATGKDVFIHATKLDGVIIEEKDEVTFDVSQGQKGLEAHNVHVIQD